MTNGGKKANYRYIDYFKALLMILVVLGHINFANAEIKPWIYAFHMPAFFVASGMLLKNSDVFDRRAMRGMLEKKVKSLLFPYFLWALIYSSLEGGNLLRILYGSHQSLGSAGSLSSLWFLPVLFEATVLFGLAQMIIRDKLSLSVKLILTIFTFGISALLPRLKHGYPWCFDVMFSALGFLLLGNILYPVISRVQAAAAGTKRGLLLCIVTICLSFAGTLLYLLNIPDYGYILMANAVYGNYLLFLLTACFGTAGVLFSAILLDRCLPPSRSGCMDILSFLGSNTLCAFVVQKPIIKVFQKLFTIISVPDAVSLLLTCIGTVIGCCLIAAFLNRVFPESVGKKANRA